MVTQPARTNRQRRSLILLDHQHHPGHRLRHQLRIHLRGSLGRNRGPS